MTESFLLNLLIAADLLANIFRFEKSILAAYSYPQFLRDKFHSVQLELLSLKHVLKFASKVLILSSPNSLSVLFY